MKLFTRDADGKIDSPLSVWFGLAFIFLALLFQATDIGPGSLDLPRWQMGMVLVLGVLVLFPGLHTPALWLFTLFLVGVLIARLATRSPDELELGFHTFMVLTGVAALVPGLFMTVARDPA